MMSGENTPESRRRENSDVKLHSDVMEGFHSSPNQTAARKDIDDIPSNAEIEDRGNLEMFRADLDKSTARATLDDRTPNEANQYVTMDKRTNPTVEFQTDSFRSRPMALQSTDEKEPKRPDFQTKGVAPFEKSDVKRGTVQYDLDGETARREKLERAYGTHHNAEIDFGTKQNLDPTSDNKTKLANEDAANYLKFLNSKKYGSEGEGLLSSQPDAFSQNTPGIQSHG